MTEFDRYVFYYNKNVCYFLHSYAGMSSPGPFITLHTVCVFGLDGVTG